RAGVVAAPRLPPNRARRSAPRGRDPRRLAPPHPPPPPARPRRPVPPLGLIDADLLRRGRGRLDQNLGPVRPVGRGLKLNPPSLDDRPHRVHGCPPHLVTPSSFR